MAVIMDFNTKSSNQLLLQASVLESYGGIHVASRNVLQIFYLVFAWEM